MKTAIGKMWQKRIMAGMAIGSPAVQQVIREAQLSLYDLLDHAGPRALQNMAAKDIRELRQFAEDFGFEVLR